MVKTYSLTPGQEAMWIEWKFNPDSRSLNTCVQLKLEGNVEVERFRTATNMVVEYFDLLRSYFVEEEGKAKLAFSNEKFYLDFIDYSLGNKQQTEAQKKQALKCLDQKRQAVLDLTKFPLISAALIKTSEQDFYFIGMVPHIISDGASALFFLNALSVAYNEGEEGLKAKFDETKKSWPSYLEYLQNNQPDNEAAKQYWQDNLRDAEHLVDTPAQNSQIGTFPAKRTAFEVDQEINKKLRKLAFANRTSIFSVIAALFSGFLKRYFDCQDVVIGYPVNLRPAGYKHAFGFFVNVLPLHLDLSGDPTFAELVKRADTRRREDKEFQSYSPLEIIKAKREIANNFNGKMFNVSLLETISRLQNLSLDGINSISLDNEEIENNEDLTFVYEITEENIKFWFEYSIAGFSDEFAKQMAVHMEKFINLVAEDASLNLSKYKFFTPGEEESLLGLTQEIKDEEPHVLHQLFEKQANNYPELDALHYGGEALTYRTLNERANQLAHYLRDQGCGNGSKVALFLTRCPKQIESIIAVLKAGGCYIPIDSSFPVERVTDILFDSAAEFIICSDDNKVKIPANYQGKILVLESLLEELGDYQSDNLDQPNPDSLAYIIYTSGSTGKPKGVMVSHKAVASRILRHKKDFHLEPGTKTLQNINYSFDVSLVDIWWPLACGAELILADEAQSKSPSYLISLFREEHDIEAAYFVPSNLNSLLKSVSNNEDITSLKKCYVIGESLTKSLVKLFYDKCPDANLYNAYGPSEAVIYTSFAKQSVNDEVISIGQPIQNVSYYILDRFMNLAPFGVVGELYIGGIGLAEGYLNRDDLTMERFIENPFGTGRLYKTGDLVRQHQSGAIEYLGRNDSQIKLRGFRIELDDITSNLNDFEEVVEAKVALKMHQGHKKIAAYYTGKDVNTEELRQKLAQKLPEHMIPSFFIGLETMPRLASGKINIKALPELKIGNVEQQKELIPLKTVREFKVAKIWEKTLRIPLEKIGANSNFFELGGDSLMTIEVAGALEQESIFIEPHELYQYRTISSIVENARDVRSLKLDNDLVSGEVGLLPRQEKFFSDGLDCKEHWNRLMAVEFNTDLDNAKIEKALNIIINHHDGLRLVFKENQGKWSAYNEAAAELKIERYDLSNLSEADTEQEIANTLNNLSVFNLAKAPLIRAAVFKKSETNSYFALIIHHLLIDMRSLRIILEDMLKVYQQLVMGIKPIMPNKTTSLKEWSQKLKDFASQNDFSEELTYWQQQLTQTEPSYDFDYDAENIRELDQASIELVIEEDVTEVIQNQLRNENKAETHQILLASLAESYRDWSNSDKMVLNSCLHGREKLFEQVSLNHTVGWLNTVFPLNLELNKGDILDVVKDHYEKLPNSGINYGLLRFVKKDEALVNLVEPKIFFNYVSKIDTDLDENLPFSLTKIPANVASVAGQNKSCYALYIEVALVAAQFQFKLEYNKKLFKEESILRLSRILKDNLYAKAGVGEARKYG